MSESFIIKNNNKQSKNNTQHGPSDQIIIPRDSFTAFRLKYVSPDSISRLSTSISLGTIPKPWILHNTTKLRDVFKHESNSNDAFVSKTKFSDDDQGFKSIRKFLSKRVSGNELEDEDAQQHQDFLSRMNGDSNNNELPEEYDAFDNTDIRSTISNGLKRVYSRSSITSKRSFKNRAASIKSDSISMSNLSMAANDDDNHSTFSRFRSFPKSQASNKNSIGWSMNDFNHFQKHFLGNPNSDDEEEDSTEEDSDSDNSSNKDSKNSHLYLKKSHIDTLEETINMALRRSKANFERSTGSQGSNASFVTANEDLETQSSIQSNNTTGGRIIINDNIDDPQVEREPAFIDETTRAADSSHSDSTLKNGTEISQMTEVNVPVSIVGGNNYLFENKQENEKAVTFDKTESISKFSKTGEVDIDNETGRKLVSFANTQEAKKPRGKSMRRQQGNTKLLRASPEPLEPESSTSNELNEDENNNNNNNRIKRLIHEGKVHDVVQNVDRYISTMNGDVGNAYKHFHKRALFAKNRINIEVEKFEHKSKLKKMLVKFQRGKIIQIDKMLVKVIMTDLVINDKTVDNKVIEKWREFIIVARSTGNLDYPIILQFFKQREISKDYNDVITSSTNISKQDSNDDSDEEESVSNLGTTPKKTKLKPSTVNKDLDNKSCEFEIIIGSKDTSVRLFNSLEKSIEIVKKNRKGNETKYILLCQNQSASIKWLSFFNYILNGVNKNISKTLTLSIPELRLSLTINRVNLVSTTLSHVKDDHFIIKYTPTGYQIPRLSVFDRVIDLISESIHQLPRNYLQRKNDPLANRFLHDLLHDKSRLAFALKKYDRLEWILGDNENLLQSIWSLLNSSHELELREIKHEPHYLQSNNLEEPLPIEGFLVKLSNRRGKSTSKLRRHYYKVRYFTTANHLLLFSNFYKGIPSFEEDTDGVLTASGEILDQGKLLNMIEKRPVIFESNHYPLSPDGKHIAWLKPGLTESEFESNDKRALSEAERKVHNITAATRVINLTEVTRIEPVELDKIPSSVKTAMALTWNIPLSSIKDEKIADACFEIVMSDGTKYRFQACNRQVRNEWIARLQEMVVYWTIKKREETMAIIKLKEKNLSISKGSNEYHESLVANESTGVKNWEVIQASTDPKIYNISSFALTKPIIMSGALYQKHRKHKNFRQFYVVLCPGYLILYDMFDRSKMSNIIKSNSYYKYYTSIKLNGSYVYCDKLTSLELIDKEKTFNHGHPGGKSIPRVYVDGWQTAEDESVKYFTIWFGSKRLMFFNKRGNGDDSDSDSDSDNDDNSDSDDGEEEEEENANNDNENDVTSEGKGSSDEDKEKSKDSAGGKRKYLKTVSRLGVTGNSLVFMARSRQERDLWVSKLNIEIERFSHDNKEEVVLV